MASRIQEQETSGRRNHGVMSDYDQNVMRKSGVRVLETEGDFPYERGEEYPVLRPPRPTTGSTLTDITDPSLCLSPDQNPRFTKRPNYQDGDKKSRVRFDRLVHFSDAAVSPGHSGDQPDLVPALHTDKPEYYKTSLADHYSTVLESAKPAATYPPLPTNRPLPQPHPQVTDDTTQCFDDPISVLASDVNDLDLSVMDTADHAVSDYATSDQAISDHPLARREINSSLFLAKELQKLEAEKPDLIKQVENKLQTSQQTKSRVEEKVYAKLNYKDKFESIASINVSEEEVARCRGVDVEKSKRAQRPPSSAKQEGVAPPDIMEFFTPDLQKEWPSYSVYTPQYPVGPRPAPIQSAFTLYRHIRSWETL